LEAGNFLYYFFSLFLCFFFFSLFIIIRISIIFFFRTPLHRAAASSNAKLVQLLIDAGADVNVQNTVGATPLHVAVTEADETCLEIVELLLYNGASLSRRTIDHKKPIDFTDNPKVKEFLKKPHPYQVPSLKKLATTAIWRYHLHTDIKGLPQELQKYVRNTL